MIMYGTNQTSAKPYTESDFMLWNYSRTLFIRLSFIHTLNYLEWCPETLKQVIPNCQTPDPSFFV